MPKNPISISFDRFIIHSNKSNRVKYLVKQGNSLFDVLCYNKTMQLSMRFS